MWHPVLRYKKTRTLLRSGHRPVALELLESRRLLSAATQCIFFVDPTDQTAGVTMVPVEVRLLDDLDQLVTSSTANVTLTLTGAPGGVSIGGTSTVSAAGGVAAFNDLVLTVAGTYSFTATSPGLTSDVSGSFVITPGSASKIAFSNAPTDQQAGALPTLTVNVEDQYGNIVTSNTSNVTLGLASGTGPFTGTKTVAAVGGVASFSTLSINKVGTYSLNASASGLAGATTATFAITPGPASQLGFVPQPSTQVAGALGSFSIAVEDQFNNVVTTDSGTQVTISINTGPGTIVSGTLVASTSNGVAIFSTLDIHAAGSYTFRGTAAGLFDGVSNSFSVVASSPVSVGFAPEPADQIAGNLSGVTVDILDQFGNIVKTSSANVVLSKASGSGTLSGTTTVAAVNGVATFAAAAITKVGTYTLSAASNGLAGDTSSSFAVTPAAASKIVIDTQPDSRATGPLATLTVEIQDQFGNLETSDASVVTVAKAKGPGALAGVTSVSAVNGIATLSGLSIAKAGVYGLKFTDGGLTSATTSDFLMGAKLLFSPILQSVAGQIISAFSVRITDAAGVTQTNLNSSITISVHSGPGSITTGTLTVVPVNGVAVFNDLSFQTSGTYTLSAASASLAGGLSAKFTVVSGAPSKLVVLTDAHDSVAGVSPVIQIALEDQYNNIATNVSGTSVTLSKKAGSAAGVLGGAVKLPLVHGVATFKSLKLTLAGSYTLTATATSGLHVDTSSFNVTATAAKKLVFTTQPTLASVSSPIADFAVSIEDAFGNLVSSGSGSVLSVTVTEGAGPSGGFVPVTLAAVGGVVTFAGTTATKSGTYKLRASHTGLASVLSSPFSVA